jgi:3-oxocholest-4-en-26-oyl-CoA dehydrogenase alpha subunit
VKPIKERNLNLGLDEQRRKLLQEFRSYLASIDGNQVAAVQKEQSTRSETDMGPRGVEFVRQLGLDGWLGVGFSVEVGGRGGTALDQWVLMEELAWRKLPHPRPSIAVAHALVALGPKSGQQHILRGVLTGDVRLSIGYTEPDAGTDLASLRTRAVRDGDEYIINGSKLYSSASHFCTHIWLAVRTGTAPERHRGISVMVVPVDTPGITIVPMHTQAGYRTNSVFFDDVRVPETALVGAEHGGWNAIMIALNNERFRIHSAVLSELIDCVGVIGRGGAVLSAESDDGLDIVGDLVTGMTVTRLLSYRGAQALDHHDLSAGHPSRAKAWTGPYRQQIAAIALNTAGPAAEAMDDGRGSPSCTARVASHFLKSPFGRFGAGTEEIQKDLVARDLGLSQVRRPSTSRKVGT